MGRELTNLHDGGGFFESPRWHDGRWWVSDFYAHEVFTLTEDGEKELVMEVEAQPSGLGWMPDGSMLCVSMKEHKVLRRSPDGEVTEHADVSEHCSGHLNDMVIDAGGHAYVGEFGFDLMAMSDPTPGNLIHVAPDGSHEVAASEMYFPNGSVILPDEKTLIVGETAGCRYTAFTIGEDGALSDRRVWAQMAPTPEVTTFAETLGALGFGPDGCALDAEDHIWSADEVNARCARVAEGGEVVDEIAAPEGLNFFACALGGSDGKTMLICAAPDFAEQNRSVAREAVLFTTQVDVPRAGRP